MDEKITVTLRPVNTATDLPQLAKLMSFDRPEPVTPGIIQNWLDRAPLDRIQQRMAAINAWGEMIGYSNTGHEPWFSPGRFRIEVLVDPSVRRQGIGSLLYTDALQFAKTRGATLLESEIRDNVPEILAIVKSLGFQIDRHIFELKLAVATFDEQRFAGIIEQVEQSGIRFFTLADLGNTLEAQRNLYEINTRYALDIPGGEPRFSPLSISRKTCLKPSGIAPRLKSLPLRVSSG